MSPRRRRSKKSADRVCRCANTRVRSRCRKFSPIQAARYPSANAAAPARIVMPRNAAASCGNTEKLRGATTSSVTIFNIQIAAASSAGASTDNPRPTAIQPRNGRASGQNRPNTARTPATGARSTRPSAPTADGRSSDLTTSRTRGPPSTHARAVAATPFPGQRAPPRWTVNSRRQDGRVRLLPAPSAPAPPASVVVAPPAAMVVVVSAAPPVSVSVSVASEDLEHSVLLHPLRDTVESRPFTQSPTHARVGLRTCLDDAVRGVYCLDDARPVRGVYVLGAPARFVHNWTLNAVIPFSF